MKLNLNLENRYSKLKVAISLALYFIAILGALRSCYVFYYIGTFIDYPRIIKTILIAPLPMLLATYALYPLSRDQITQKRISDVCWWYLFVVYAILVAFILFAGGRQDYDYSYLVPNFVPLASLSKQYLQAVNVHTGTLDLYFFVELAGNILLFAPLAFLLPWKVKRKHKFLLSCGILMSAIIAMEILQEIFVVGVFDVDDILLNFLGLPLGFLFHSVFQRILMKISVRWDTI